MSVHRPLPVTYGELADTLWDIHRLLSRAAVMADALADLAKPPAAGGRVSAGEDSLGDRIVELLMGTRMKAPTIAEMLGVNPASVRDRLSKDPRFDREPTGFWVVVQDHLPLDAARAEEES